MKKYILIAFLIVGNLINAQTVNNYKAVVVPIKYDFLNKENAYRLNTMSKFNLKKAGFEAYYSNEQMPKQYSKRCDLLYLNVEKENGFLVTKLFVTLKDCEGKLVFQSETGKSKEKDYQLAYTESLNLAFESINALHYSYEGEFKSFSEDEVVTSHDVVPDYEVEEVAVVTEAVDAAVSEVEKAQDLLYAQPIENGYQLIDATPKVVMKVIKTSSPSTYIATREATQGVLVSKNGSWYFEYYQDKKLISEIIKVKF